MILTKYVLLSAGNNQFNFFVPTRFYGRNSSYVHGGLDPSGKLAEAVYGQAVRAIKLYFSGVVPLGQTLTVVLK